MSVKLLQALCNFANVRLQLYSSSLQVNLNLAWTYYFTGILIASSVAPIAMSITWARATAAGVISGVIGGHLLTRGHNNKHYLSTHPLAPAAASPQCQCAPAIGGCMAGMVCWLALASTYPGGLTADTFVRSEY